jgi:ubiquitin carboxyl-terminal hydrolase 25/28
VITSHELQVNINRLFYTTSRHIYPGKELADEITIFNTAIINLHDKPLDICEALDINFGREDVDDKGKVVKRYQTVLEPAPFLQIYFQNQDYKPITRADGTIEGYEARLIQHHVKLPEIINMDRYMENSSPELLQLRQRSWELQEHRKALRTEHAALLATNIDGLEGPDALDATWQFINELGDELDDTFVVKENIKAEVEQRRSKIEGATKKIEQIDKELYSLSFDKFDTSEHAYKLFAVFVHRGTSSFGHYWIYIHDFVNGIWRKYEDSTVSVVTDLAEIFEAKDSRTQGVPNFVVYVKNDRKDELTDVLHRVKPETVEGGDLEMADVTQPQIESQNSEFTMMELEGGDATQFYHG